MPFINFVNVYDIAYNCIAEVNLRHTHFNVCRVMLTLRAPPRVTHPSSPIMFVSRLCMCRQQENAKFNLKHKYLTLNSIQVTAKFYKLEREYRDCIGDKKRKYSIPHDAPGA